MLYFLCRRQNPPTENRFMNDRSFNLVDFWRIVFTLLIMTFHFDDTYDLFPQVTGWYISVEFFFLVSGYLLYDHFLKKGSEESALDYTLGRLRRIYPPYVIMFAVYYLLLIPVMKPGFEDFAYHVLDSVPELLLLQGAGLNRGWNYVNNTTWYLSVMLIAGYLIFALLKYRKELFLKVAGPLLILCCYAYLYRHNGSLDAVIPIEDFYRNYALMRGFAGMLAGVYLHLLRERLSGRLSPRAERLIPAAGCVSFALVIILATQCRYTVVDYTYLIMIAFGVFAAFLTVPASDGNGGILPAVPSRAAGAGEEAGPAGTRGPLRIAGEPDASGRRPLSVLTVLAGITLEMYLLHDMFRAVIFPVLFPRVETTAAKLILLLVYYAAVALSAFALNRAVRRMSARMRQIFASGNW